MLWSQVRKEINRLEIVMPETEFPEWFDYHAEVGNPEFWARGKLPIVAIAFVVEKVKYEGVGLQVLVDGKHVHGQRQKYLHNLSVAEDHLLLCDLRVLLSDEDWKGVDARLRHDKDWKCVKVNCETQMILRFWGVYVYKQETNMDGIQFTRPNSWTRDIPRTIERNPEEEEKPNEATSINDVEDSDASGEEASSLESENSKPLTHTCSPFCISILSTLKKLICCNAQTKTSITETKPSPAAAATPPRPLPPRAEKNKGDKPLFKPLSPRPLPLPPEASEPLPPPPSPRPRPRQAQAEKAKEAEKPKEAAKAPPRPLPPVKPRPPPPAPQLSMVMEDNWEGCVTVDLGWGRTDLDAVGDPVDITSPDVEMRMHSFSGWGGTVDNTSLDFEKQMLLPSSSESLQTVVGNLKRIMAVSSDEEESESESEA